MLGDILNSGVDSKDQDYYVFTASFFNIPLPL